MFWSYPVSADIQDWVAENFEWAIDRGLLTRDTPLVLPTETFFKAPKGKSEAVAAAIFEDLKRALHLEEAKIDLLPLDVVSADYRMDYNSLSGVGGTWQGQGDSAVIRYDPAMFNIPLAMMSTLTHELMHHVLHAQEDYPPGGAETEELATDLHMITMGLGVIALSGAEQAGWQGYLSQPSRAHALALFLMGRGMDPAEALRHLPARSGKYVRRALRHLKKDPDTVQRISARLS